MTWQWPRRVPNVKLSSAAVALYFINKLPSSWTNQPRRYADYGKRIIIYTCLYIYSWLSLGFCVHKIYIYRKKSHPNIYQRYMRWCGGNTKIISIVWGKTGKGLAAAKYYNIMNVHAAASHQLRWCSFSPTQDIVNYGGLLLLLF